MYFIIIKKIEHIFVFFVAYIAPVAVTVFLWLLFWKILPIGQQQRIFANIWRYVLMVILMIKPISVLIKRYLNPTYRRLPDWISYLIKWRIQEPILIYIKHLIVNSVYSLCLYGLRLRKRLGILAFWAIFTHRGIWEIKMMLVSNSMVFLKGSRLIQTGVAGLAALIIGAITSNIFFIKLLQRRRRPLQQIAAYIAFAWACLHIFFVEYERSYIILLALYIGLKIWERWPKKQQTVVQPMKPAEQIPEGMMAKIINRKMLTYNILELTLEVHQELKIIPGQWALLTLKDNEWYFNRPYSIVDFDVDEGSTMIILVVKLINGRWTSLLQQTHIGDSINIKGIYGTFILQNNDLPKIFIGTWTWLAPLMAMAKRCESQKQLFFSVPYTKDVFYEEKMNDIPNLTCEIHTTREEHPVWEYHRGRIDWETVQFPSPCEIYVCGWPNIVEDIIQNLQKLGHKNIFSEKF